VYPFARPSRAIGERGLGHPDARQDVRSGVGRLSASLTAFGPCTATSPVRNVSSSMARCVKRLRCVSNQARAVHAIRRVDDHDELVRAIR
jgi:hypothetical protein